MTTTSQAAGKVQEGEDVTGPELDTIERMYDETMACIADMADPYVEPWPETEEIDVASIKPPAPARRSRPEPDRAPGPRRPWRRWFSFGAWGAVAAR